MLVLLHALIPCLAAYMLPSSLILLHIYCICFPTFWHCYPYILQHLMEIFYSLVSLLFLILACKKCSLRVCEPHPFYCSWSCEMHVSNNEEMTFNYTEVLVYCSLTTLVKGTAHRNNKPFGTKIKVNTCTNFVLGHLKKKKKKRRRRRRKGEEEEEIGFLQFHVCHC